MSSEELRPDGPEVGASDAAASSGDRQVALLWGTVALACLVAAPLLRGLAALAPPCPVKALTGWPCLGCGSTRALLALAALELPAALRWNPLATLGALAFLGGGLAFGVRALVGRGVSFPTSLPRAVRLGALATLAACWVFLVLDGR